MKLLVRRGLNASHLDNDGRGALQRAAGTMSKTIDSADENTNLAAWLLAHAKDTEGNSLVMTYQKAMARAEHEAHTQTQVG